MHELGLLNAFDAVYGASAGAISAAWLVSSRPEGLRGHGAVISRLETDSALLAEALEAGRRAVLAQFP
ncbi:hypothetical protein [Streptomyces asiaticus]|uniref:hypothetical protein n=1 Tax=Streptomyces asiaticus TaxID=114695 RepID=UPI0037F8F5BF